MATVRTLAFSLLLGVLLAAQGAVRPTAAQPALEVTLQTPAAGPGQDFTLVVRATGVTGLFGLSFELSFPDSRWVDVTSVEPIAAFGSDVLFFLQTNDPEDETGGRVSVGLTRKAGQGGVDGDVEAIRIQGRFAAEAPSTASFVFSLETVTSNDADGNTIALETRDSGSISLPVALVAFEAVGAGDAVILTWRTASEANNAGFEVQRRIGAEAGWRAVRFVEGAGTTREARTYTCRLDGLPPGRHAFRLRQVDFDGRFTYSDVVEVDAAVPERFALEAAYPNPFNPATIIRYSLPVRAHVVLTVYDVLGHPVATLVDGLQAAGRHEAVFTAGALPGGTYFYRMAAGPHTEVRSVVLVR